jgi:diguanylate cyclase (GGDEF)-like protein
MRTIRPKTILTVLAAMAAAAGVLMLHDVRNGMAACRALNEVDLRASQLEGELEFHAEESRRWYLYALALADANEQPPYVDRARAAEADLRQDWTEFRRIAGAAVPPADMTRLANALNQDGRSRDAAIARILAGDTRGAVTLEANHGAARFGEALDALRIVKRRLGEHARGQAQSLNGTLLRGSLSLGLFMAVLTGMFWVLVVSRREKDALYTDLRRVNADLSQAHRQEQRRGEVLRMMGRQESLSATLGAVAMLADVAAPGASCGIWVWNEDVFLLEARAGAKCPEVSECLKGVEELPEMPGAETAVLRDGAGGAIGIIRVCAADGAPFSGAAFIEMAQLATMAIESRRMYDRLAFQAQHDLLTGLPNRVLFRDRLEQSLELSRRNGDRTGVLWVDLDGYKQINDTLGHAAGDDLLCQVGRRLRDAVRLSDTVARMGGDEFGIVLGGIHAVLDAEKVAAKIQVGLSLPFNLAGHEVRVSGCCGISLYPDHASDAATLVRNADLAMYTAKRSGRNASVLFQPDLGDSWRRRRCIEQDLPDAMAENQLHMEYQPLVDREGKVRAIEALLRWDHPELGRIPAAELIAVAEESDAIIRVGEWVIRHACTEARQFLDNDCVLSINVSRKQLARTDFATRVAHILRTLDFPASQLEFEVKETALMRHLDTVIVQIRALRELGVRFAVDDFGAGYSSLHLLGRLPVDSIKIDRSFVEMLGSEPGFGSMIGGLISLAHSLAIHVVAEGVETEEQLRILHDMECDLSQGFLLHRPMPREALLRALAPRRGSDAILDELTV